MAKKRILSDEEKAKKKLAKKELKQFRKDFSYITEKIYATEETRSLLEKVTTVLEKNKSYTKGASPDKIADGISELEDLKGKLSDKTLELLKIKKIIEDKIDLLPSPYRDILFYKYIRDKKWIEIADEIHYDHRYIKNELHEEALYLYSQI